MTTNTISEMAQLNSKLDELSRLNESEYESNKAITLFQYFDKIYTLCNGTTNFQTLIDTLLQRKYAKLCYPIFKRIHTDVFKSQQCWHVAYYLLHSLWNYTDKTSGMCVAIVEAQFVPMLLHNLNRENYLKHFASNDAIRKLFDMIVSILHNIAQIPELVDELRRNQCLEALNRLIQTVGSASPFLKGLSYLTLAYVIREEERAYLTNSNESIPYLVGLLHEAVNNSDRRSNGLEAREICKGLSKLSVANDNKSKIFSESKLLDSLLNMLQQHANSQEQISACTLIWNLVFDQNVRKSYQEHKQLNEILNTIAQSSSNDELRRTTSGCLCTLMGGPTPPTKGSSATNTTGYKNVMISYNHDIKQLTKQIKDRLAADGYDVWIDLENMHGNLLDAMANAIEKSTIFLMCLTEKYKDSPSCRLECEYAYQRKKKIIPLLFQANYKPDGWLGIMLGTKFYINYAKKPFDAAYSETISELQAALNTNEKKLIGSPAKKPAPPPEPPSRPSSSASASTMNESTVDPPKSALVHLMSQFRMDNASEPMPVTSKTLEKMSITDTQRLLAENGLEKFMSIFMDIDGIKLVKLFEIKNKAPQCYYMLLKDKWDQMNEAKERSRDTSSPNRIIGTSTSMAQFLQLTIALDKLADRISTN